MFTLPDNNNISVSDIYVTAHTVRILIARGFTSLDIHKETGMPISAIDVMIAEYAIDNVDEDKHEEV